MATQKNTMNTTKYCDKILDPYYRFIITDTVIRDSVIRDSVIRDFDFQVILIMTILFIL